MLRPHGYEYVVVDFLWYRRKVKGANTTSLGFDVIDEWGRMVPDPVRWPSSKGGKGFTEVARKVHNMGLKFGIHIMRGISTQAVNANTRILDTARGGPYEESGRQWRAKDIGIKERACAWMSQGFMSVNTTLRAGQAFLRSLHEQYAEWGVDFVKHDCVFGADLDIAEIRFVSEVLKGFNHPIIYSLSPGTTVTPALAEDVSGLANMYRITGDDWDKWEDVAGHFNITRDFARAGMTGAKGLLGKSWPDLDMLPLGWLSEADSNQGPHRTCNLTLNEQRSQMTLWSIAKSPLMFGGDARKLDASTHKIITNPTLLKINHYSSNNMEFSYITGTNGNGSRSQVLNGKSRRNRSDVGSSGTRVLSLTSCKDAEANGWTTKVLDQDLEQICWKKDSRSTYGAPFCLYKRKPLSKSDEEMSNMRRSEGRPLFLGTEIMGLCLDASSRNRLTSKEFKKDSFSPCIWDANQMWELNLNGSLISTYSGLCALVETMKAKVDNGGISSWIATGRTDEIYVAFFNLEPEKMLISAKLSDLFKALPHKSLNQATCISREVWSGKYFGVVNQSLSMAVERHGCALFVLQCT